MAKGDFIEYVVSDNPNKYPMDGEQSGYYWELYGGSKIVTMISFTINGTSYQAEDGMTWEQFANSEYNSGNKVVAWAGTDHVTYGDSSRGTLIMLSGVGLVTPNDIIIDNGVHTTDGMSTYPPIAVEPT